jgi:RES domain-containing protein
MPIIYAAESQALAALEMLGHLEGRDLFHNYVLIPITIEDSLVRSVKLSELPGNWRSDPAPLQLKRVGDEWLQQAASPVLRVPSALLPQEHNFLLNTEHPAFSQLGFGDAVPFRFDPCLIKKT